MFEDKTFESILDSMLNYVKSKNSELDINDGSIIYTALAPIALELETAYHNMDMILDETFVETASKEYLVKFGNQVGLPINEATYGHYEGEFDVDVEIGSRFNLDKFNYTVIEKLSDPSDTSDYYVFELVCETAGSEPNEYFDSLTPDECSLTPITYVANLTHAELASVHDDKFGEDEEDTEKYRYRLQVHAKNPPINGNVAQYHEWLDNYPENRIGKYRVTPCWDGANTVKITILNSQNTSADEGLVAEVQEYFDPHPDDPDSWGMGNGVAPIGAIVTVATVDEIPVTIDCTVAFKEGYTEANGGEQIKTAIKEHLSEIALEKSAIEYMPIMAAIYNTDCVGYVQSLTVEVNDTIMNPNSEDGFVQSVMIGTNEMGVLNEASTITGV